MPFCAPKCMTRSVEQKSPFGAPSMWQPDRLPTRKDVGAYYFWKRAEMQSSSSTVPSVHDVCVKVMLGKN